MHTDIDREPHPAARLRTMLASFRVLKALTSQQVDRFLQSYVIYNLDWSNPDAMAAALGPNYPDVVGACLVSYYSVLNHLCALGEVEKMYIPPLLDAGASILENQRLYEQSIAEELGAGPEDELLDLGCGRGRVAAHIAQITGARVTGLNIDLDQLARARANARALRLPCTFVQQDFNRLPLPFGDACFDGFYQIQALSLCKDLDALFRELNRVLRSGARLSLLDWVSLPAYDPMDPHHQDLMRLVKPLIGAVGTPTPLRLEQALEGAGFRILKSSNASQDGLQAPLIERADTYFRALRAAVSGLVRIHALPAHFRTLLDRLTEGGEAFIEADRLRLCTTSYHLLAEKPG
jgi:sterol 24-C-methyltransferase